MTQEREIAVDVRAALKKEYKKTTFSVTPKSGAYIHVRWMDGPGRKAER